MDKKKIEWIFHVCGENWGDTLLGDVFILKGFFTLLYDSDLGTFKGRGVGVRLSYTNLLPEGFWQSCLDNHQTSHR